MIERKVLIKGLLQIINERKKKEHFEKLLKKEAPGMY